jgi:hypothetical protein
MVGMTSMRKIEFPSFASTLTTKLRHNSTESFMWGENTNTKFDGFGFRANSEKFFTKFAEFGDCWVVAKLFYPFTWKTSRLGRCRKIWIALRHSLSGVTKGVHKYS